MLAEDHFVARGHLGLQAQAMNQLALELRHPLPLLARRRRKARAPSALGLLADKLVHERLEPGHHGLDVLRVHASHALLGEPVVEAGKGFMGEIAQLPRPEPLVGSLGSNARLHEPPIGAVEVLLDRRGREHGQTLGRALKVAKKRKRPQAAPRRAEKLLASRHRGEGGAKRLRQVAFAGASGAGGQGLGESEARRVRAAPTQGQLLIAGH